MEAWIETDTGEEIRLAIPMSVLDITYEQWADFVAAEHHFLGMPQDTDAQLIAKMDRLTDAMVCICGEAARSIPTSLPGDDLLAMIDGGYLLDFGSDITIERLYAHLTTIARAEEILGDDLDGKELPTHITLDVNGETFTVHGGRAARVMMERPLNTGEAIEVMEYRRRAGEAMKRMKPHQHTERSMLDYTLGISEFAILVKKPGERLPTDEQEREDWITQRRQVLSQLSLRDVIRVRFFLTAVLKHSSKGSNTSFSGRAAPVAMRRRSQKRRGKGSANRKP